MIDAEERAAMAETVRGALVGALARDGGDANVDDVLSALGWREMLEDHPDDAIDVVFGALGATNATATALDDLVVSALGQAPRADVAVLLPGLAAWAPPGRIDAGALQADGLATGRVTHAREIVVVCGPESEPWMSVVPTRSADVRAVRGLDPDMRLRSIHVDGDGTGATRLDAAAWRSAVALGRRAVAHQIAGAGRTMLDLARTHALERVQFGRPIARFQAVRHRLAEVLVAVESLEAALDAARDEPGPETAALAKAVAGRTAHAVSRHCQQVLAGVGFTTEHPFHRFLKRTMTLEGLFGSADAIVLEVGRRLLAERRVPTLIDL